MYSTHKIIGISTISRTEHNTAQTRELACTKEVLPQVLSRGMGSDERFYRLLLCNAGLNITEVAHDMQLQVAKHIKNDLQFVNSFDTWHGESLF